MKTIVKCLFSAGLWCTVPFFCGHAQDIGSDTLPVQKTGIGGVPISEHKQQALTDFIVAAVEGTQRGSLSETAFKRLFSALDNDPESAHLLVVTLTEIRKTDSIKKYLPQLGAIAAAHPEALPLNLTTADLYVSLQQPEKALGLLTAAWRTLYKQGDPDKLPEQKKKLAPQIFSKMLTLQSAKGQFGEAGDAIEQMAEYPQFQRHMQVAQAILLVRTETLRNYKEYEPELLFYLPQKSFDLKGKCDLAISRYLDAANKADYGELMDQGQAFQILRELGHAEDVKRLLLFALMSNPEQVRARIDLAQTYSAQGEYASEARVWKSILSGFPQNTPWSFYYQYGLALEKCGRLENAVDAYELALLVNPKCPCVILRIAHVWLRQGKWERALKRIRKLEDSPDKAFLETVCNEHLKRYDEAQKAVLRLHDFLSRQPNQDKADRRASALRVAVIAEKNGDLQLMERMLRNELKESPDDPELLNFLGYSLADHNQKLSEAETLIRKALTLEPDKAEYLDSMAWVLFRRGDLIDAVFWIKQSMAAAEKSESGAEPEIYDHAAEIYFAMGDIREALRYWKLAIQYDEPHPEREKLIGKILKRFPSLDRNRLLESL